jgi:hypothetical protein
VTVKERIRAEIDRATRRKLAETLGDAWYRSVERSEAVVEVNYLVHATTPDREAALA